MAEKPFTLYNKKAVTLAWTGFAKNDTSFIGTYDLAMANTFEEMSKATSLINGAGISICYATSDNHIGYYGVGLY